MSTLGWYGALDSINSSKSPDSAVYGPEGAPVFMDSFNQTAVCAANRP